MSKNSIEKYALSFLNNAKDFRSIKKEDYLSFFSGLTKLDPTVAIEQLKQFINYANSSKEMYKNNVDLSKSLVDSDDIETKEIYELEKIYINSLSSQLEKEDISAEERSEIINNMSTVIHNANQRKNNNQSFKLKIQNNSNTILGIVTLCLASTLGATVIVGIPKLKPQGA